MAGNGLKQVKGKPGLFSIRTAKGDQFMKLVEWTESQVYDTVEFGAALLTGGQQWQLFQNIQNKLKVDCNMATPRRLTSGTEMILNQIGVLPGHNHSSAFTEATVIDYAQLCERIHYELRINNTLIVQGPVHCFPSGFGVTGATTVATTGYVTNGLASPAAVPRLLVPQNITSDNDISAVLTHSAAPWIVGAGYTAPTPSAAMLVKNILRGYIKTSVGKG
jgi:hypothetical protein